jgi:type I restriction enzyme, S subunit
MTTLKSEWPKVQLGKILTYLDKRIELDDMTEYVTITVKRRHGGLEAREKLFGHQIKTKKQFRLIPDSFIISRVQCWHEAYALVPDNMPSNMIASTNYDQFAISPEVDRRFFWWLSYSPRFKETVRDSAVGVVIEKMVFDREAWLQKTLPFPSLKEQQRIVAQIEKLADKIKEASTLRQQAAEKAEAVVKAALHRVNKGILISGTLNDVLTAPPRNGWSARCDNDSDGIPVLALGAVTGFHYQASEFKRTSLPVPPNGHFWLKPGDLLITRSNTPALVGHAAIYNGSPAPCIYPDLMMRLELREGSVERRFIWYWLQSPAAREFIGVHAKGTSPTMKKISQSTVMSIPFPSSLSIIEQRRIVAELDTLQAEVDTLNRLQAETATELDALQPSILDRAFKGGI